MERAGNYDVGSITALYTILVERDDMTEPVADEMRSILNGHIVLSRKLANKAHYPAVDLTASISRVMNSIVDDQHRRSANRVRELVAKYQEVELLLRIGECKKGSDAEADEAIEKINDINNFIKQDLEEGTSYEEAVEALIAITEEALEKAKEEVENAK